MLLLGAKFCQGATAMAPSGLSLEVFAVSVLEITRGVSRRSLGLNEFEKESDLDFVVRVYQ